MTKGELRAWVRVRRLRRRLMTEGEVRAWVRVRRMGRRLAWHLRGWLRRVGRVFRRPRGKDAEARVLGPRPEPPAIRDQDVRAELEALAPDAGEQQLQSWLSGLLAHRDQGQEVFPFELFLSETAPMHAAGQRWLHRLELDRRPSLTYLAARFGAPLPPPAEPAELLVEVRPAKRR